VTFDLLVNFGREIVSRAVVKSDVGALTREDFAHGRTDTARSSGYERALSLKQKTHLAMFLLNLYRG
jgi:hypothetical protein